MSWLTYWHPRPSARLRLVCLPYAGGTAAAYRDWAASLSEDIEVVGVELPGHGTRHGEPFVTTPAEIADALVTEPALVGRPVAVYGHSMGGLLGLELARAIRRRTGRAPVALLVSSCDAPWVATTTEAGPWSAAGRPERSGQLSDAYLHAVLDELGGTGTGALADTDLMATVLPVLRADVGLVDAYEYTVDEPLRCAVRVYAGTHDTTVSDAGLAGWRRESPRDFRLSRVPGGHFFIHEQQRLHLAHLASDLAEIGATSGLRA